MNIGIIVHSHTGTMNAEKQYNSLSKQDRTNFQNEAGLPKWGTLYKITGIATVAMLILITVQIAVFTLWPMPKSVLEWFQLLQNNWLLGLLHLDLLYIINNSIVALMYLALYMSLRHKNDVWMLLALIAGLLATAAYYSSNPAFEMLSLSRQFAASVTELEGVASLAVGQTLIAQWKGTAFDIYYILSAISLIIIAVTMFKSTIYGKATAVIGLSSGLLMLVPSSAGTLGLFFALASLVPWVIFSSLAAKKFFQLSRLGRMRFEWQ